MTDLELVPPRRITAPAAQGIWVLDARGRTRFINRCMAEMLGCAARDVLGRSVYDFVDPATRPLLERQLRHPASAGVASCDLHLRRRDGSAFLAVACTSPVLGPGNHPMGAVALVTDTAGGRDRLVAAVRASGERLCAVVAAAPVVLAEIDTRGVYTLCLGSALGALDRGPADLLGRPVAEVWRDRPEMQDALRHARAGETVNRTIQVGARWFEVWTAPARPGGAYSVACDVTPRVRSEQSLAGVIARERRARAALERANRRLGFLASASAVMARSLDYATTLTSIARLAVPVLADCCVVDLRGEDGELRVVASAHVDPDRAALLAELQARYPVARNPCHPVARALRTGRSVLAAEVPDDVLRGFAEDDAHLARLRELGMTSFLVVPLAVRGQTLGALRFAMAGSGRVYDAEAVAVAEDLALRAALAVDHARLYREARAAVQLREELLSIASHELKSPLTALRLQIQSLLRNARRTGKVPAAQLISSGETIERQCRRVTTIADTLLDLSRISAGRLILELEEVDLAAVAREVAARFDEQLRLAGCPLTLVVDRPMVGTWDRLRLEQIVTNLLSNAMKYGCGGAVEVTVGGDEAEARLAVRDHGIGIAPEHLGRIFDRFERAASEREFAGVGLGLYIVRQIVDALGGAIGVASTPGEGSTFTVRLPRRRPTAAEEPR